MPSHHGRAYERGEIVQLLHDAVVDLMGDGTPFRELSVERLRLHAGISRSSFSVHFADKTDMLRALERGALERLYAPRRAWIRKGAEATRDDIRAGMRELLDRYLEDEVVMRAISEVSGYDAAIRGSYIEGAEGYARTIEWLVRTLRESGRCPALHPPTTARALAWMTERTVFLDAPGASARRLDAIAASLADIVHATLFAPR